MLQRVSLIVATKDRPNDLRRLLESLRRQTVGPDEILVVDASHQPVEPILAEFPELKMRYLRRWPPSAAAQRNIGIQACDAAATLIGFADDDTTFESRAFENMLAFWSDAAPDLLGAAFNIRNYPPRRNGFLKYSSLTERLGLYSPRPGSVSPSGWQTIIGELPETQFVDWVPSTAVLFRREVFDHNVFDEFFDDYSYLEDLDFGYTLSRVGRLAVVANAGFSHFPSTSGRVSARAFGRYEVRNRLYFVRKHCLSISRCYLGLTIRLAMSIGSGLASLNAGLLLRALGNIEELMRQSVTPLTTTPLMPKR
jgi:GT2 family glycosyltransferase